MRNKISATFTILVISWQIIGLYFRAIPDANLLDTVCISMRVCIFTGGSHKEIVFAPPPSSLSLSLPLVLSLLFLFTFFEIHEWSLSRCISRSAPNRILRCEKCRANKWTAELTYRIVSQEIKTISTVGIKSFMYYWFSCIKKMLYWDHRFWLGFHINVKVTLKFKSGQVVVKIYNSRILNYR